MAHNASVSRDRRPRQPLQLRLLTWLALGWKGKGVLSVLWFLLVMSVILIHGLVSTTASSQISAGLAASSVRETVDRVEVRIKYVPGRFGGWYEVAGVRIRLDGSPGWTELQGVDAANTSTVDAPTMEGWQPPTDETFYAPPLDVLVQRDEAGEVVQAMAATDFDYLRGQAGADRRTEAFLLAGAVGGGILLVLVNGARLDRRDRRDSTSAWTTTSRRWRGSRS